MNIRSILRTLYKMERPDFGPGLNQSFVAIRTLALIASLYIALHHWKLFAGLACLLLSAALLPFFSRYISQLFRRLT